MKVLKSDVTNKWYLAQKKKKKIVLFNCIFYQGNCLIFQFLSWEIAVPQRITPNPYNTTKNIQSLLAGSVCMQQVPRVLILSILKKYISLKNFIYLWRISVVLQARSQESLRAGELSENKCKNSNLFWAIKLHVGITVGFFPGPVVDCDALWNQV